MPMIAALHEKHTLNLWTKTVALCLHSAHFLLLGKNSHKVVSFSLCNSPCLSCFNLENIFFRRNAPSNTLISSVHNQELFLIGWYTTLLETSSVTSSCCGVDCRNLMSIGHMRAPLPCSLALSATSKKIFVDNDNAVSFTGLRYFPHISATRRINANESVCPLFHCNVGYMAEKDVILSILPTYLQPHTCHLSSGKERRYHFAPRREQRGHLSAEACMVPQGSKNIYARNWRTVYSREIVRFPVGRSWYGRSYLPTDRQ